MGAVSSQAWTGLAIACCLSLPLHGTKTVLALTVLASGCFFAYARSYVLSAVFVRHVSPWRCFVKALPAGESV